MSDEGPEPRSIGELIEEDFEELSYEEWADLLESVAQAINSKIKNIKEEQQKIKEAYEHRENISEAISRLETLRDLMEEYEKDARMSAMAEEVQVDEEIIDDLTQLLKTESSDLKVDLESEEH